MSRPETSRASPGRVAPGGDSTPDGAPARSALARVGVTLGLVAAATGGVATSAQAVSPVDPGMTASAVVPTTAAPVASASFADGVTTVTGRTTSEAEVRVHRGQRDLARTTADADGLFSASFRDHESDATLVVSVRAPGSGDDAWAGTIVRVGEVHPVTPPDGDVAIPAPGGVDDGFAPFPEPVVAEPAPGDVDPGFTPAPDGPEAEPAPGLVDPGFTARPLSLVGASESDRPGRTVVTLQTTPGRLVLLRNGIDGRTTAATADDRGRVAFDLVQPAGVTVRCTASVDRQGDLPAARITFEVPAPRG